MALISGFVLMAFLAIATLQIMKKTERSKDRNIIWFLVICGDMIVIKLFSTIVSGTTFEFYGIIAFLFVAVGIVALFILSKELLYILEKSGSKKQGANIVFILDAIMLIVIIGLFIVGRL